MKSCHKTILLSASMTVEAALILPVVLLVCIQLLTRSLQLHDQVKGSILLNDALEAAGYAPAFRDGSLPDSGHISNAFLFSEDVQVFIERNSRGLAGSFSGPYMDYSISDRGFFPEKTLRALTLLESLKEE